MSSDLIPSCFFGWTFLAKSQPFFINFLAEVRCFSFLRFCHQLFVRVFLDKAISCPHRQHNFKRVFAFEAQQEL